MDLQTLWLSKPSTKAKNKQQRTIESDNTA